MLAIRPASSREAWIEDQVRLYEERAAPRCAQFVHVCPDPRSHTNWFLCKKLLHAIV
jgi:hypothetical protein